MAWAIEVSAHATDKVLDALGSEGELERLHDHERKLRRASESCALAVLRGLRQDLPADQLPVPAESVTNVRDVVRFDIPLDKVLRAMWMSHVHTYETLLAELERALAPAEWAGTVRRVSDLAFTYVDVFAQYAAREYEAERERWLGSVAAVRRRMIDEILAGHPVSVADAEGVLAVRLKQHHVAAIVWPYESDTADASDAAAVIDRLRRTATALAQAVQAPALLAVPGEEAALWVWLCWKEPPPGDTVPRLRETLPSDLRMALGPVDRGLEGFRRSHLRAREAERVARTAGAHQTCDYSEVAVVSLLTANRELARWFIEDTLGELGSPDTKTAELRETLRLYLAFGHSRKAAAERLHIAPTTVAYRVKRAETLLHRELGSDELQLRLALEISGLVTTDR
ncbi:PucR family transcriptional regulator [Streptomyces justiciae]|uniref:PucR family transcriptional regulator n=1 Tax=Streptomyces justiciae TaxID=2780140 RepID=UPI00211794F5|nr:helix-turn-helix domain-containing protein [Streptomyces justiciae]MCW8379700.1 helix-turn-helix domain-containing protein [Streptomyces justiciae]